MPEENGLIPLEMEIFKAGDYGEKGAYTEADLDQMVAEYQPSLHEAPLTIGHPEHDKPAFGWVEKLSRVGKTLVATARAVPALIEALKHGRLKKRSAAIYKDFQGKGKPYLRHVAFLGAMPPEVKGLADISFREDGAFVEFSDSDIGKEAEEMSNEVKEIVFTESQHRTLVDAELVKQKDQMTAAFNGQLAEKATRIGVLETEVAGLKTKLAEFQEQAKKAEVELFVEGLLRDGKLIPAQKEKVVSLLLKAASKDSELFAELRENYTAAPKIVEFGEIAGLAAVGQTPAASELIKMVGKEAVEKHGNQVEFSFARR